MKGVGFCGRGEGVGVRRMTWLLGQWEFGGVKKNQGGMI